MRNILTLWSVSFSGTILSAATGQQVKNKMLYMWVINIGEEKNYSTTKKGHRNSVNSLLRRDYIVFLDDGYVFDKDS